MKTEVCLVLIFALCGSAQYCRWYGTAPFCDGGQGDCKGSYFQYCGLSPKGDGQPCWTGDKALCCQGPCPGLFNAIAADCLECKYKLRVGNAYYDVYRGCRDTTLDGSSCQRWDSLNIPVTSSNLFGESPADAGNKCRLTTGIPGEMTHGQPWCFKDVNATEAQDCYHSIKNCVELDCTRDNMTISVTNEALVTRRNHMRLKDAEDSCVFENVGGDVWELHIDLTDQTRMDACSLNETNNKYSVDFLWTPLRWGYATFHAYCAELICDLNDRTHVLNHIFDLTVNDANIPSPFKRVELPGVSVKQRLTDKNDVDTTVFKIGDDFYVKVTTYGFYNGILLESFNISSKIDSNQYLEILTSDGCVTTVDNINDLCTLTYTSVGTDSRTWVMKCKAIRFSKARGDSETRISIRYRICSGGFITQFCAEPSCGGAGRRRRRAVENDETSKNDDLKEVEEVFTLKVASNSQEYEAFLKQLYDERKGIKTISATKTETVQKQPLPATENLVLQPWQAGVIAAIALLLFLVPTGIALYILAKKQTTPAKPVE